MTSDPWKRPLLVLGAAALLVGAAACGGGDTTASSATTGADGDSGTGSSSGESSGDDSGPTTTVQAVARPAERSLGCDSTDLPQIGTPTDQTITSNGVDRTYRQAIPASYNQSAATPLVIDLHGYIEGAQIHVATSAMEAKGSAAGFVTITPQGTGALAYWNAGPTLEGPDDVGFIEDLIDEAGSSLCIDLTRVYVTGFSNGAMMSSLVACELSDRVAAIAPVAGLLMPNECSPARPMPIVAFHGTADPLVAFEAEGAPPGADTLPFDEETQRNFEAVNFQPTVQAFAEWGALEGCAEPPTEQQVSPSVRLQSYSRCDDGSTVQLYIVDGGGHTWPGSPSTAGTESPLGSNTSEIVATDLMWTFFQSHQL